MTDQLKAILSALATFAGKRIFAWLTLFFASMGVAEPPMSEQQIAAVIAAVLAAILDWGIYQYRHRNDPPKAVGGRNRCLLVGINAYPAPNELAGCVNDVDDVAAFLIAGKWFKKSEIRFLKDKQATAKAIRDGLTWLAADYRPGDKRYFHYSGHGAQMDGAKESDGLFEVICPVDFDWSTERAIRDVDFNAAFGKLPSGAILFWASDSCHSAGLASVKSLLGRKGKVRAMLPPPAVAARINARIRFGAPVTPIRKDGLNVSFLSGCSSAGTSADATFGDRANGAFTYFYLKRLKANPKVAFSWLDKQLDLDLSRAGFDQRPEADGINKARPFLQ